MPLLNPPDILPEAMRYLLRTVLAHKEARCPRSELLALVAPEGLTEAMRPLDSDKDEDPDTDTAATGRLIADRSLSALISLGFVAIDGTDVTATGLALDNWRTVQTVTATSFGRAMRSQLWHIATADIGSDTRVADLVNALAVLFATPEPLRPFEFDTGTGRHFADAQVQWFGPHKREWPVTNATQFRPLCRWAPYLGLAQPITGRSLVADASRALLQDLADLPRGRFRAAEFIAHCRKHLPICDGGSRSLWKTDASEELSPGMSMSLCQLEASGAVTFPAPESDTDTLSVVLGRGREPIRISHIDWHPNHMKEAS
ncbi:protein DpdG [Nonomuraea jabiensis]|uniref:protein DpdG n=1 Tax=Nonomuraea jabiensis TaxID=882448 RepID=UPI00369AFE2D